LTAQMKLTTNYLQGFRLAQRARNENLVAWSFAFSLDYRFIAKNISSDRRISKTQDESLEIRLNKKVLHPHTE